MMKNLAIFFDFIKKLFRSRSMIRTMAVRELKKRYVGSLFGVLWAVLHPVSEVVIYGMVFGVFFKSKPDPIYGTDSYILVLLCGLVPWQFFAQAVTASSGAIVSSSNIVKKAVGFPSEILPIITVISNMMNHFISLGILLLIVAFFGKLSVYTPLVVLYLFFAAVFSIGLGWILSSLSVFLRDVQQVVGVVMMALFFGTPVFYSLSVFPKGMLVFLRLNPMFHVVQGYKLALLAGSIIPAQDFAYLAVSSFVTFGVGGLFFKKLKPAFAEVL
ncbi:MAG: ABC transporter permease [Deltaproteobacteria bacterium]|nr:ABC transporter permease [Deltaproteobacteria bacterium]